jgi:phi LC3 family holin
MFKFQMDFSKRISNPAFCVSLIGAIIVLLKMCGLDVLANFIPKNYADIITQFFAILSLLGIVVDPSTPGISDKINSPNEQGGDNTQDLLKDSLGINASTATGSVQANDNLNASSKITVDVPQE